MKERSDLQQHDKKVLELLGQIERHLATSEKESRGCLAILEKVTPFLATVVLGAVTAVLTYSISSEGERTKRAQVELTAALGQSQLALSEQQSAAQLALSKQQMELAKEQNAHTERLARIERITSFRESLESTDKLRRRVALTLLASLGDEETAARVAAATQDTESLNQLLITSVKSGDLELAQFVIRAGADLLAPPAETKGDWSTPMLLAAERNDAKMIKLLCKNKANPDVGGNRVDSPTPLMAAVRAGAKEAVDALLDCHADVKTGYARGGMPAFLYLFPIDDKFVYTFYGNDGYPERFRPDIAQSLIRAGVDINTLDVGRDTLINKVTDSGDLATLRDLIDLNADINRKNFRGETPLMTAASSVNIEAVKLLLEKGAEPNQQDGNLWTPLMSAAFPRYNALEGGEAKRREDARARAEIVDLLVLKHALLDIVDDEGRTALIHAATDPYTDCLEHLIRAGADYNIRTKEKGNTALFEAVQGNNIEGAKMLVNAGANVNDFGTSDLRESVLNAAVKMDPDDRIMAPEKVEAAKHDLIDLLLKKGASPDTKDEDGATALASAVLVGDVGATQRLLEANADPDATDNKGRSPRSLAAQSLNLKIKTLLSEAPPKKR